MKNKTKISSHVLVLTAENTLIYSKYSEPVTHIEVYHDFLKESIQVKDCYIENAESWNMADILLKAIGRWVSKNYGEDLDRSSVYIRSHNHKGQYIVLEINGKTTEGQAFSVSPSELISPKINFFEELC